MKGSSFFSKFEFVQATERILWGRCRSFAGSIPMDRDDLPVYVEYACEDWYMK